MKNSTHHTKAQQDAYLQSLAPKELEKATKNWGKVGTVGSLAPEEDKVESQVVKAVA